MKECRIRHKASFTTPGASIFQLARLMDEERVVITDYNRALRVGM